MSPNVVTGALYTMAVEGESETAYRLRESDGEVVWRVPLGPVLPETFGNGPRSTPRPAWKLKVTRKDGSQATWWYLGTSNYRELARFDRTLDLPAPKDRWTYYSDFRTVDGLVIPHRQDQEYFIRTCR